MEKLTTVHGSLVELVSCVSWLLLGEACEQLLDSSGLDWCVYLFQPVAEVGSEVLTK